MQFRTIQTVRVMDLSGTAQDKLHGRFGRTDFITPFEDLLHDFIF